MKLILASVCDAATIRETLLNVLGGGATTIVRPSFPSPFGAQLALQFLVDHDDAKSEHEVEVTLSALNDVGEDEEPSARLSVKLALLDPDKTLIPEGEQVTVPIVASPLAMAPLPRAGRYHVGIRLDGVHLLDLPIHAIEQPSVEVG